MTTDTIVLNGRGIDLSPRVITSTSVVGSPATNAQTIVASVTLPKGLTIVEGVDLLGWAAFTVGTSGASATGIIRQTGTSGTSIATTGALTVTATNLVTVQVAGFDSSPSDGQVYKLTLTIGSGAAESTVSAVYLRAIVV